MRMKTDIAEILNQKLSGATNNQLTAMEKEMKAKNKETKLNARDIKNPITASMNAPSQVQKKIIAHKGETTAMKFNITVTSSTQVEAMALSRDGE